MTAAAAHGPIGADEISAVPCVPVLDALTMARRVEALVRIQPDSRSA